MNTYSKLAAAATLVLSVAGCHGDFLSGGELSTDPNRPTSATAGQLFVGVQSNIYYTYSGDLVRIGELFPQQIRGISQQYFTYYQYTIDENTSNGAERQLYGPGGLADVRRLQQIAADQHDSLMLGIAQVQEAMLMGFAADVYGNIVYTQALTGVSNPTLDSQHAVFDSLQALLSRAITNMAASGSTNAGPGGNDITYGGDPTKWTELAHSLKARFYMHVAEVDGVPAYQNAAAEAALGIQSPTDDYVAVYSGSQAGEGNPWYQFVLGQAGRSGYFGPGAVLDSMLKVRNDPRRTDYFHIDPTADTADALSDTRLSPTYSQPIVTAAETHLIRAEASYRAGDPVTALLELNAERAIAGLPSVALAGNALLVDILSEEYINDFQLGVEAWKLYRRTCFPNLASTSPNSQAMPGRLYHDQEERQTNTNIPAPGTDPNGLRNEVDPQNATSDGLGGACLAGA